MIDKDIIVMGDFNIPSTDSALFQAITGKGLCIPPALLGLHGTNLAKNKRYDQLLHYPAHTNYFSNRGGVLDFYMDDHVALFPGMTKSEFTFQMSDHLPLWIQVRTDTLDERLNNLLDRRKSTKSS
jgi:endonuclease/exonuclease/phosphatase family metal-dependent hydrolase